MTIRKDSPFYGITEEQIEMLLQDTTTGTSLDDMAEAWETMSKKPTTGEQVRRFLKRARRDRAMRDSADGLDDMEAFAERAKDGKVRDGVIEAARQRLMEEALESGDSKQLMELYRAANEERAREREVEVERRKAEAATENAKIGWRRLELQQAESALKLLPKLAAILLEESGDVAERLGRARAVLMSGGGKLLGEKTD